MNPWPVDAEVAEVHLPRPGHADLAGIQKFGFTDVRNVLERASARETAARVAAGALAKAFLRELGVTIRSHVTGIGSITCRSATDSPSRTSNRWTSRPCARSTPMPARRWWPRSTLPARPTSRSGTFEVIAFRLVPGIGSHISWEERLDGRLAGAIMSIQAMKGWASATASPWRAGSDRRPTTRSSSPTSAATTARPTAPAGSRAG